MFSFGFSGSDDSSNTNDKKCELQWDAAKAVLPSTPMLGTVKTSNYQTKSAGCLKLVQCEEALKHISQSANFISEAESMHSDLMPAKYEGGLKIWECTEDLANYLADEKILQELSGTKVLDLGCGTGILGILAMQLGAVVHFQDYNEEVLRFLTYKNVCLNTTQESQAENCYFSGDWESFADMSNVKYHLILTSETIYNPDCHKKLLYVFKKRLADNGTIYLAAKTYYFGVGGGLRQFEKMLEADTTFQSSVVWKCSEGVQREILKIKRKM